jgi:hypothetical protein
MANQVNAQLQPGVAAPRRATPPPQHRCTVASATAIAQQIDSGGWRYVGSGVGQKFMQGSTVSVSLPDGSTKAIPTWFTHQGMLVLRCPVTGELFMFTRSTTHSPARAPRGLGAVMATLAPCEVYNLNLTWQPANDPQLPSFIQQGLMSPPDSNGVRTVTIINMSGQAWTLPQTFGQYVISAATSGGISTTGACAAPPPATVVCPPGKHWNGTACVGVMPIGTPCPAGTIGSVINGRLVCQPVVHETIPAPTGATGPVGTTNAGIYTYATGHRTQMTTSVSGGGSLPPAFLNLTNATVQAQMDSVVPGAFKIASVSYVNGTLVILADYCGKPYNVQSPQSQLVGTTTVSTTYQDMGASPAGVCPAAASTSMSTGTKVALGVVGAAVLGGGGFLAYKKFGKKRR